MGLRRLRAVWKALRDWLKRKRLRRPAPVATQVAAVEAKNPLRLDDAEYNAVMRELDDVLAGGGKPEKIPL